MKKEYIVKAGRPWKLFKQSLSDESLELEDKPKDTVKLELLLSDRLGIQKGDLIKVTLESLNPQKTKTEEEQGE